MPRTPDGAPNIGTSETIPAHIEAGRQLAEFATRYAETDLGQFADAVIAHAEGGIAAKFTADLSGPYSEAAALYRQIQELARAGAEALRAAHEREVRALTPLVEAASAAPVVGHLTADEARAS